MGRAAFYLCETEPNDRMENIGFFFQAEDGIRDLTMTGVQTCALPISVRDVGRGDRLAVAVGQPGSELEPVRETVVGDRPRREPGDDLKRRGWCVVDERVEQRVDQIGRASCRERV